MALERTHTPQNLLQAVGEAGTGTFEPWASYQERIPGLVEGRTIGTVTGTMTYDAAMRPLASRYTKSGDCTVFGEQLRWTPRNQLAQRQRLDLNGWSEAFTYDRHDRLTGMERQSADGEFSLVSPSGRTARWAFTYDNVHNLLSREEQKLCSVERTEMPVDDSGRHRPASVGGKALVWNANGELIQKGDQHFTYDYRGRLVKIEQEADGQLTELVNYTYDVLNRRVEQHFPNRTIRTVWDGWQPIEEYEVVNGDDGEPMTRRIYGRGIDEVVRLENRLSSDNAELQAFLPFYDSSGNLALMTSFLGGAVERYAYSPYGERHAWADTDRPAIEQVRIANGDVVIEMSEAVDFGVLGQALADSTLMLQNVTQDEDVAIEIRAAVTTGRQAYRRIVLEVDDGSRPADGDSVRLTLPHTGVVDYFGNSMDLTQIANFAWPVGDEVFTDTVPPKVSSVCTTAEGRLEIQFSEPVNLATANAKIEVDNQGVTWTVAEAGYSLVSNVTLSAGSHELEISTDLLDLDDLPLADDFSSSFVLADGNLAQTIYTDEQERTGGSILSNALGFQGLHHDAVSGLIYVRNRYYDPEMGRFITPDPMGFVDGLNVYQFAVGNPVNYRDPLGFDAFIARFGSSDRDVTIYLTIRPITYSSDDSMTEEILQAAMAEFSKSGEKAWAVLNPAVIFSSPRVERREGRYRWANPELPFVTDVDFIDDDGRSNRTQFYLRSVDSWDYAHEFGHHLGLRDQYIPVSREDNDGVFWTEVIPNVEEFGPRARESIMGLRGFSSPNALDLQEILDPNENYTELLRSRVPVHHLDFTSQGVGAIAFLEEMAEQHGVDISTQVEQLRRENSLHQKRHLLRWIMNTIFRPGP